MPATTLGGQGVAPRREHGDGAVSVIHQCRPRGPRHLWSLRMRKKNGRASEAQMSAKGLRNYHQWPPGLVGLCTHRVHSRLFQQPLRRFVSGHLRAKASTPHDKTECGGIVPSQQPPDTARGVKQCHRTSVTRLYSASLRAMILASFKRWM